jgi:energy-coupling factor transporter ATP-binding protein EcfA2
MWLKGIRLTNIKSFADSGYLELSEGINVFVGANNSGKSTLLRSIQLLQPSERLNLFFENGLRVGAQSAEVLLDLADIDKKQINVNNFNFGTWKGLLKFMGRPPQFGVHGQVHLGGPAATFNNFPAAGSVCFTTEPNNFIYPYVSLRKALQFNHGINQEGARSIEEAFPNLPSKIDRLCNPDFPSFQVFREICKRILGFTISSDNFKNGKHAGLILQDGGFLPVNSMGEGTIQILSFLAHLCIANGKLFLIEEIEDDIHPKALKALLEFVIEKSASNQFIVTTHNNIVAKYLGSAPKSRLFSVEMNLDAATKVPVSTCSPVPDDPESRIQVLENLGYEPFDYFLWKGYLILEESTAERLIRDFFVPYMIPSLQGKLKTIAASGITDVEARLSDLMRLFVFIHTAPQYKGRAWVAGDNGVDGQALVEKLKAKFPTWPPNHFKLFSSENFEKYYPAQFQEKASEILALPHGMQKQKAKGQLAEEVLAWALSDPSRAKEEFKVCAKEIIEFLEEIRSKLA